MSLQGEGHWREVGVRCYEAGKASACVSECLPHELVTRAGEGVGEGRVEEGGGVRGC